MIRWSLLTSYPNKTVLLKFTKIFQLRYQCKHCIVMGFSQLRIIRGFLVCKENYANLM